MIILGLIVHEKSVVTLILVFFFCKKKIYIYTYIYDFMPVFPISLIVFYSLLNDNTLLQTLFE